MKTILITSTALLFFLLSCKKDKSDSSATTTDPENLSFTKGTWVISSFTQRSEDRTDKFSGMSFTFSPGGNAIADDHGNSVSGTWTYSAATPGSTGYYNTDPKPATLSLNFVTTGDLSKVSRLWNISQLSSAILKLDDPEATEDEHLTFSKQ